MLECDFAEVYGIIDCDALSLRKKATLAAGLAPDSRSMRKLTGRRYDDKIIFLAGILDALRWIQWSKTKDAQSGLNRPESILSGMLETKKQKKSKVKSFRTYEEFEAERRRICEKIKAENAAEVVNNGEKVHEENDRK